MHFAMDVNLKNPSPEIVTIRHRRMLNHSAVFTNGWLQVYPIPAAIYLVKNLLQYVIFLYVDAPSYQILKNLNIISTGVLYRLFLKKPLSAVQWSALILLALGCTIAQTTSQSEKVGVANF